MAIRVSSVTRIQTRALPANTEEGRKLTDRVD
jgi:hypothetical protein